MILIDVNLAFHVLFGCIVTPSPSTCGFKFVNEMSCLIHTCFKQRLAQVGTCWVAGRSYRTGVHILASTSHPRGQQFCGCPCPPIRQLNGFASPMLSQALVRRGKVFSNPEQELRDLVDEVSGVKDRMEELRDEAGRTIITVPLHLEKRLEKRVKKESTKFAIRQKIREFSRRGDKSVCVHTQYAIKLYLRGKL